MQREYSKNSFIYTIDSLFCVPDEYIVVDNDDPVALSLEQCRTRAPTTSLSSGTLVHPRTPSLHDTPGIQGRKRIRAEEFR